MTDKERILMMLLQEVFRKALYDRGEVNKWQNDQPPLLGFDRDVRRPLERGDLVVASTSFRPNDYLVGFVHEPPDKNGMVVIREIGSDRLCNYGNESFMRLPKHLLGYELLEGVQYKVFRKVEKAFAASDHSYVVRFGGLEYEGNICKVKARKVFSDDILFTFEFHYNSETSIKSITDIINKEYEKCLKAEKEAEGAADEEAD